MRRIGFLLSFVALLMISCAKETVTVDGGGTARMGEVTIALTSSDGHQNAVPVKSTVEVPEVSDFKIEIFNAGGVRLYRDTYANSVDRKIPLNAGEYRLLASHGNALGVGFDAIYFAADVNFTVHAQTSETVEAVARMANVKVAVEFGENLLSDYPEHYARVKNPEIQDCLQFDSGETRAGYIPAGDLILEVYVNEDGTWKYYKAPARTCSPNDFMTFHVDIDPRQGGLTVGVMIDDTVDLVEDEIRIPATAAPGDAPSIEFRGFDGSRNFTFIEAVDYQDVQADFLVHAGIKSCVLSIESDFLAASGLPASVDLTTADESVKTRFAEYGIRWNGVSEGSHIGSVDFSGLGVNASDPSNPFKAAVSLTVTDRVGKTAGSESYTLTQAMPEISVTLHDYNAFARRIEGLTANVPVGNPSACELQYSSDNAVWIPVTAKSVEGQKIIFDTISGLKPGTEYSFRTVYNGNEAAAKAAGSLTTEEALQIGNNGFEEWYEWDYYVNKNAILFGDNVYQTNYAPYASGGSRYWDSNNSETTPGDRTPLYSTYKSFPMVTYVPGHESSKAAQIMTIAISNTAMDSTCPLPRTVKSGRLFTGEYGSAEETAFSSRPAKMSFYYKYSPYDSDSFKAYVYIKSGDTIIGEGSFSSSASVSAWKYTEIDIDYSRDDLKAQTVHVDFISGVDTKWTTGREITYGGNKTAGVHGGSILAVDDVEFIYE